MDMLNLVKKPEKRYIFPYSEGHIKGRTSRFKEEYSNDAVRSDFNFAESINDQFIIESRDLIDKTENEMIFGKLSMMHHFEEQLLLNNNGDAIQIKEPNSLQFKNFKVDMDKISEEHPLYTFLKKLNSIMSSENLQEYLIEFI